MSGSADSRGAGSLKAVERVAAVLKHLAARPAGTSLADLSRATAIPMTTLHRLLALLRAEELVGQTQTGLYTVGVGTVILARGFLDGIDLRDIARPEMVRLVEETGEACHLGVLAAVHIVYLEKVDSPHPVRMVSRVGGINPAVTTALGRAILAHERVEVIEGVVEETRRVLGLQVHRDAFHDLLAEVRQKGYSSDLQENEKGICCIGAPITDHTGRVTAALSLSVPATRFDAGELEARGRRMAEAGRMISAALGWRTIAATAAAPGGER